MPGSRSNHPGRAGGGLPRRLGLYFVGVSIGLVLVGFLLSLRGLIGPRQSPGPEAASREPGE